MLGGGGDLGRNLARSEKGTRKSEVQRGLSLPLNLHIGRNNDVYVGDLAKTRGEKGLDLKV